MDVYYDMQLDQPEKFMDMVLHKLLMGAHDVSKKVAFLQVMTWCYEKYHTVCFVFW